MNSCIFCKIVEKEIPNYTVYEDADVLAFLDIHPHAKGHTVVIPKVHAQTIFDLPQTIDNALMNGVRSTMLALQETLHPEGFNIGWNHNTVAGQSVPHVHIHILPRWSIDNGTGMHGIVQYPTETSVADISKLFQK